MHASPRTVLGIIVGRASGDACTVDILNPAHPDGFAIGPIGSYWADEYACPGVGVSIVVRRGWTPQHTFIGRVVSKIGDGAAAHAPVGRVVLEGELGLASGCAYSARRIGCVQVIWAHPHASLIRVIRVVVGVGRTQTSASLSAVILVGVGRVATGGASASCGVSVVAQLYGAHENACSCVGISKSSFPVAVGAWPYALLSNIVSI